PVRRILVGVDFGAPSLAAVEYARDLARTFQAVVYLVAVVDNVAERLDDVPAPLAGAADLQKAVQDDATKRLAALAAANSVKVEAAVITSNDVAAALLEYANTHEVGLIVLGTHGRSGFADLFMGSVAQQVVRRANCPVLTLRE